jgi:hypothetical protein
VGTSRRRQRIVFAERCMCADRWTVISERMQIYTTTKWFIYGAQSQPNRFCSRRVQQLENGLVIREEWKMSPINKDRLDWWVFGITDFVCLVVGWVCSSRTMQ